ncbi:MAG: T9SS type A sorting domain-containing protein [Hymenobacteraceae bacterium]|nr:T9SS type A sorting domain-containing protein [Hymenobacteraceae bacterium]
MADLNYVRYIGLFTPADLRLSGLPDSAQLSELRFYQLNPGSAIAGNGSLRVWLARTTDTAFRQQPTTWNTLLAAPTALTQVYDGGLLVPLGPQWYGVSFNTGPAIRHRSGYGYYIAFEWQTATTGLSTGYLITTGGGASYYGGGATAPATLWHLPGFRPWIQLGAVSANPTGLSSEDAALAWELWPNPAQEALTVRLPPEGASFSARDFQLRDLLGRLCLNVVIPANTQTITADVRGLAPGLYVASLKSDNRQISIVRKVFVAH